MVSICLLFVFCCLGIYSSQECCVHWGSCFSDSFGVSNGVHQESVLSLLLFCVYLDGLLSELVECGVGFAGCLCYADDISLLAPCPSALRVMLNICCKYASCHGLELNNGKSVSSTLHGKKHINGHRWHFVDKVSHLGHILTFNIYMT